MNVSVIKSRLVRNISNIPGWRSNRKIVVIESDDWGSVRMPSIEVCKILRSKGLIVSGVNSNLYNMYDTLASPEDLNALFDLLSGFRDKNNNPCVITAATIVANPDFEKIKENNFSEYYYEPFTKTLNRYYHNNKSFELWKKGIEERLFVPQFHGREHLNVAEWMRALKNQDKETLIGFEHGVWGFIRKPGNHSQISYQAAFDFYDPDDLAIHSKAITEGLSLFNELFGYNATFFVPPNGPFSRKLDKVAIDSGIKYISTSKSQLEPQGFGKNKRVFHWLGEKDGLNQRYMIRNCFFEPCQGKKNWVDSCLKEIEIAFRWNKPAIISSHRVNYIGTLDKINRDNGLSRLNLLLKTLLKRWPDTEFLTSDQLGSLIATKNDQ